MAVLLFSFRCFYIILLPQDSGLLCLRFIRNFRIKTKLSHCQNCQFLLHLIFVVVEVVGGGALSLMLRLVAGFWFLLFILTEQSAFAGGSLLHLTQNAQLLAGSYMPCFLNLYLLSSHHVVLLWPPHTPLLHTGHQDLKQETYTSRNLDYCPVTSLIVSQSCIQNINYYHSGLICLPYIHILLLLQIS